MTDLCSRKRSVAICPTVSKRLALAILLTTFAFPIAAYAQDNPPVAVASATLPVEVTFVVIEDLVPHPVPFCDVNIVGANTTTTARADANGILHLDLPAGEYTVETSKPITYKGKTLVWKMPLVIKAGAAAETQKFTFTDADAKVGTSVTGGRKVSEEAAVYQAAKAGVVTVESDWGHGSGFIVDKQGLVLTNQHVIGKTRWVTVKFNRGERYNAVVVAEDKDADLAVIRFNPAAREEIQALKLADTTKTLDVVEGERVVAIGSPLRQEKIMTTGVISKVEKDVLISDVNINHGNSGGPLLNMAGEVIGINTFGDFAANGPGISGIVSIRKAAAVMAEAQKNLASTAMPGADLLPDISPVPIPSIALNQAAHRSIKPMVMKQPRGYETRIMTPFTLASVGAAYDRELSKGRDSRVSKRGKDGVKDDAGSQAPSPFWMKYAMESSDPVVMIEVKPGLHETRGSKNRGFWSAIAGGLTGEYTPSQREDAYNNDFYDMELYRGGKRVEPVRRYRVKLDQLFDGYYYKVNDTAYGGMYFYDPSVFDPSEPVIFYVRDESNLTKKHEIKLSPKQQKELYDQFSGYREALKEKAAADQSPTATK